MLRRIIKEKKGQGLVELAIVLPILLLLLFGIIEFGRIMGAGIVVTQVARDSARYGVVGATDSEIVNRIQTKSGAILYDPEDPEKLIIDIERTGSAHGEDIEVKVSYTVDLNIPLITSITGDAIMVHGNSVMRVE